jgi:hypothetical protein
MTTTPTTATTVRQSRRRPSRTVIALAVVIASADRGQMRLSVIVEPVGAISPPPGSWENTKPRPR